MVANGLLCCLTHVGGASCEGVDWLRLYVGLSSLVLPALVSKYDLRDGESRDCCENMNSAKCECK